MNNFVLMTQKPTSWMEKDGLPPNRIWVRVGLIKSITESSQGGCLVWLDDDRVMPLEVLETADVLVERINSCV